jgi:hypothetical protein
MLVELRPSSLCFQEAETEIAGRLFTRAVRKLHEAEALGYDATECRARRWRCWMLLGDYESAWRESDLIRASGRNPDALWDGRPLDGKRILIRCLHGYGDAIQFIRYAGLLKNSGSEVIAETHPEMTGVLASVPSVDRVRTWAGDPVRPNEWDQQIEVMELPYAFRTIVGTIPAAIPYIQIPSRGRRESRGRLGAASGCPRVGLVWASSDWDPARSVPARVLVPLLDCGVKFYSLQHGPERGYLNRLAGNGRIFDAAKLSSGIADTAADIANMDLVITVDTMVAHLAGAIGTPAWLLLPFHADWRWMIDREDSPWYPAMRIFRQPSPGNWLDIIDRIAGLLRRF